MLKLVRGLMDECLPKKLKREFANCSVMMVREMSWVGKDIRPGEVLEIKAG